MVPSRGMEKVGLIVRVVLARFWDGYPLSDVAYAFYFVSKLFGSVQHSSVCFMRYLNLGLPFCSCGRCLENKNKAYRDAV